MRSIITVVSLLGIDVVSAEYVLALKWFGFLRRIWGFNNSSVMGMLHLAAAWHHIPFTLSTIFFSFTHLHLEHWQEQLCFFVWYVLIHKWESCFKNVNAWGLLDSCALYVRSLLSILCTLALLHEDSVSFCARNMWCTCCIPVHLLSFRILHMKMNCYTVSYRTYSVLVSPLCCLWSPACVTLGFVVICVESHIVMLSAAWDVYWKCENCII
jgi:hypothetical protein